MTTFHFDLRHLESTSGLEVDVTGVAGSPSPAALREHTEATRRDAACTNAAFAALPDDARAAFTHWAELPDEQFAAPAVRFVRVVAPADPGVRLREVKLMTMHLPEGHLRAFYADRLAKAAVPVAHLRAFHRASIAGRPGLRSAKLTALGLSRLPGDPDRAIGVLLAAQNLTTPLDTAATLVTFHPDLANTQPYTATIVLNDHVLPDPEVDPAQYNAMLLLSRAITARPSWSPVVRCTDKNGQPLSVGYDLGDGKDGFKVGDPLFTFGLDPVVEDAAAAGAAGARKTAFDDMRLVGKTWAPAPGTSVIREPSEDLPEDPSAQLRARAEAALARVSFKWTVTERTRHHGIAVDSRSIVVDDDGTFSIDASNIYLRTLYAGYQLLDDAGNPIGDKELLRSVTATNTIMGIPTGTDPTKLTLPLGEASGVRLLFGSLGTTDWDPVVSRRGALLTGLWQYGVPTVFLLAGREFTSTGVFHKIVNDKQLQAAVLGVGFGVVGGGLATGSAVDNTKSVMTALADCVLAFALQKGLEMLGSWLVAQVGTGALTNALGPVGWTLRLAATALNVEEMLVTTGEVLSSPACVTVTAKRAIDVTLTLHPDPKHGAIGHPDTALWPSVASRYVATLQYKDGTSFQLRGDLPATTSAVPLPLTFSDVPAGGSLQILAGVYSDSGWLAGSWQSEWLGAVPTTGTTLELGDRDIKENLVPLAGDTQYVFKERIVSDGHDLRWSAGGAEPAAPITSLSCGGEGIRQGLIQGPRSLAVSPDGRILVLETVNKRVQAFDAKGNAVPSFTPGPVLFRLDTAGIAGDLDAGSVPEILQTSLANAGVMYAGVLDRAFAARLDTGTFQPKDDPLIRALSEQGVLLAYDPANMTDPTASAQIKVVHAGLAWTVTDPRGFAWGITATNGTLQIDRRLTKVHITTEKTGKQWLVVDETDLAAWRLAPSSSEPGRTEVRNCLTFFPLRQPRAGAITYLDMAVEAQGYVYVLAHLRDGSSPADYLLDIYAPDGTFVVRTPDPNITRSPQNVVAGRIAVDVWRNLFALTFDTLHAPGPQPGIAHWTPTPPLFTLPLSTQPDFNERNIGAAVRDFASQGARLSSKALIEVVDQDGTWTVKDGASVYHIYRSGDGLQVYTVPA